MFSIRFNRLAIAAAAIGSLALPGQLLAQTPERPTETTAPFPNSRDLKGLTTAGSYLAASVFVRTLVGAHALRAARTVPPGLDPAHAKLIRAAVR